MDTMDTTTTTIIISTLCASVTAAAGSILNYMRESRKRQWDLEDRRLDREERLQVARELKAHTRAAAEVVVDKLNENNELNIAAIAAGEKAYTEANNLSLKIAQQGLQLRAPHRQDDLVADNGKPSGRT